MRAATFLMFYMKQYMCYPGKVESMILVIDLGSASLFSQPYAKLKGLAEVMTVQFRC